MVLEVGQDLKDAVRGRLDRAVRAESDHLFFSLNGLAGETTRGSCQVQHPDVWVEVFIVDLLLRG